VPLDQVFKKGYEYVDKYSLNFMGLTTGWTIIPIMVLGGILFISIVSTATLGILVSRGKATLNWHLTMVKVTIIILIIHGAVSTAYFLGY
jgi:hypothetical protein